MIDGLAEALDRLALRGETVSYGDLARGLRVPGPRSIATLTAGLEELMAEDAGAGRALRAVLCHSKVGGMPARGFFEAASRLGRYSGGDAEAFVAGERAEVFGAA